MEPPVPTPESQPVINRLNRTPIHTLDNDSLLNIFCFCRLVLLDRHRADPKYILPGQDWMHERWWYKLVHVCQRWRYLVLGRSRGNTPCTPAP
ncbi:hypothetical protein BC826DRAFT_524717 [Russula brevipes]|nr:hypothetical protein BC826DRAFT_524717 [Russula brevipes]